MSPAKSFIVMLSHSNRPVDLAQCSRDYLVARYADPDRLANLPPLEALEPLDKYRHRPAGMTVLRLTLEDGAARFETLSVFDPPGLKVQHACLAGGRLVVCLEDALLVFDGYDPARPPAELDIADARRIDDSWFAALHTVFADGPDRCIVSASSADAVLEVDLAAGRVIGRTRLPAEIYGQSYALAETDDLRAHYISNDEQVAHMNCASPDGEGGVVLSTLIQGDIGQLDAGGRYRTVSRGHVGCHAARATLDGSGFYFADSCAGALVTIDRSGNEFGRFETGSRWLHDVQQVTDDLFLFCPADRNSLELIDVTNRRVLASQRFDARGGATQFASVAPFAGKPQ